MAVVCMSSSWSPMDSLPRRPRRVGSTSSGFYLPAGQPPKVALTGQGGVWRMVRIIPTVLTSAAKRVCWKRAANVRRQPSPTSFDQTLPDTRKTMLPVGLQRKPHESRRMVNPRRENPTPSVFGLCRVSHRAAWSCRIASAVTRCGESCRSLLSAAAGCCVGMCAVSASDSASPPRARSAAGTPAGG